VEEELTVDSAREIPDPSVEGDSLEVVPSVVSILAHDWSSGEINWDLVLVNRLLINFDALAISWLAEIELLETLLELGLGLCSLI
jgi:hypothetical protein